MSDAIQISGKAIVSSILGVLSLVLLVLTGIPAMVLGLRALREVNMSDGALRGRGLAITGMLLGAFSSVACVDTPALSIFPRFATTALVGTSTGAHVFSPEWGGGL